MEGCSLVLSEDKTDHSQVVQGSPLGPNSVRWEEHTPYKLLYFTGSMVHVAFLEVLLSISELEAGGISPFLGIGKNVGVKLEVWVFARIGNMCETQESNYVSQFVPQRGLRSVTVLGYFLIDSS